MGLNEFVFIFMERIESKPFQYVLYVCMHLKLCLWVSKVVFSSVLLNNVFLCMHFLCVLRHNKGILKSVLERKCGKVTNQNDVFY